MMKMTDVLKRLAELDAVNPNVVKEAKKEDKKDLKSEKKEVDEGVTMEQMSMDTLRLLAGMTNKLKEHGIETVNPYGKKTLKECGPAGMPGMLGSSAPSTPASISVTAGSGEELGSMLKTIMSLAGVHPVGQEHMPIEPGAQAPMQPPMGGEPDMKALIDVVTDEPESELDTMNDIEDDSGEESEEDEGYDNSPRPQMGQDGVRQFGDANSGDHRDRQSNLPKAKPQNPVETMEQTLFADYKKFVSEAAPDKKDIPAWKRKEKGGDWKTSKADLEKEKDSRISDPKTLAKNSGKKVEEGKDEGKPGKNFAKIAKKASKEYGSKEAGNKVAGAVKAKLAKQGKL